MGPPANGAFQPFEHQERVRDYFAAPHSNWRGLLLYHSLGSGKTCTAILAAAASASASAAEPSKVFVLSPAALRPNYEGEMGRCAPPGTVAPTFLAYNGLQRKRLATMRASDFDGAVVVIDEVHNFCARAASPGTVVRGLYELLMRAQDARFLLLSGTPIVNRPREIAFAANLARGLMRRYEIALTSGTGSIDAAEAATLLKRDARVADVAVHGGGKLSIAFGPPTIEDARPEAQALLDARDALADAGAKTTTPRAVDAEALPTDPEEFDRLFLHEGSEDTTAQGHGLFMRRVAGLISHVQADDRARYPRFEGLEVVRLPMGREQTRRYVVVRNQEIRKERLAARASARGTSGRNNDGLFKGVSQVYRAYSRAACDFAFPPSIERPYASQLRRAELAAEADLEDDDVKGPKAEQKKKSSEESYEAASRRIDLAYAEALGKAMNALRKASTVALKRGPALAALSCKFEALIPRLAKAAGPTLVYSQFRTVEGLGALAIALQANGWAQWTASGPPAGQKTPTFAIYTSKVSTAHTDDPDDAAAMLAAFNAPQNQRGKTIRALLVTQSGAEGISLKCVREVHLLEPYWNDVRMQQVIGRAVRADSHVALPAKDRTVRAYLYLATLPKSVYDVEPALRRHDGSQTTDEYVHDLATTKARVIGEFLGMLRSAAIDCTNKGADASHSASQSACYVPPKALTFEPNIKRDASRRVAQVVVKGKKKYVILDGDVNTLYDYAAYKERGEAVVI